MMTVPINLTTRPAVLCAALSAAGLWLLEALPLGTFPGTAGRFLLLVIGGWPGLLLLGHVADAVAAPVPPEMRARILNDRYLGSFGVAAVGTSLIVQLTATLIVDRELPLWPLPLLGLALGFGTALVRGQRWETLVLMVIVTGAGALGLGGAQFRLALVLLLASGAALVVSAASRSLERHDQPSAPQLASHAALLTLLIGSGT